MKVKSESHSVTSDSLQPHGLYSPWNSPGQNTGVGSLSLLQGIFLTQGSCIAGRFFYLSAEPQGKPKNTGVGSLSLLQQIFLAQELNWGLLYCRWILYQLSSQGSPPYPAMRAKPRGQLIQPALPQRIQATESARTGPPQSRPRLPGFHRATGALLTKARGVESGVGPSLASLMMRRSVPHPATPASPEQLPQEQQVAGGGRPTLSTLARVLAEVSTYCTPHSSALALASSTSTCLRSSRSDLFPTTSSGILSSSALTRRICSLWWWIKKKAAEKAGLGAQFCQPVRDGRQGWGSCRLQPILRKHPSTLRLTGVPQVWFQFAALVTGGAHDKCRFLGP